MMRVITSSAMCLAAPLYSDVLNYNCEVAEICGSASCAPSQTELDVAFSQDFSAATFRVTKTDDEVTAVFLGDDQIQLLRNDGGGPNDGLFFVGGYDENIWLSAHLETPPGVTITEVWSHNFRRLKATCFAKGQDE